MNHGVDVAKAVGVGLIITLWVFIGTGHVIGINAVAIAHIFEGFEDFVEIHIAFIGKGFAEAVTFA